MQQVPTKPTPRPLQIDVPKPFHSEKHDTRVCIFVKDPEEDFKKIFNELKVPCVAEVIGFDRLARDFRQFKDKRQLLRDYDVFLADIRIYKMLPEKLGKEFYTKKAYPCPIKLHDVEDIQSRINDACKSTFFVQGNGPNYSVKVGKYSQEAKDVAKNAEIAIANALGYVTCWDNIEFGKVSQMTMRIGDSTELPIYNHLEKADIDAYMKN